MRFVLTLGMLVCVGCQAYDDLPLLEVESIDPAQVEPGSTLRIHGRGFPLGRPAVVDLSGRVYRPGLSPSAIDVRLAGDVENETLILVPVTAVVIERLGGRATFDGRFRLSFRTADDRRDVFDERPIVLDFLPDTSVFFLADADAALEETEQVLDAEAFGVGLSREESGAVGVRVDAVEPGGLAARQGVLVGDTLVALDGVRLHSWRDFLPDPSRTNSDVSVIREGLKGVQVLRWPHPADRPAVDPVAVVIVLLFGLIVGWFSPIAISFSATPWGTTAVRLARLSLALVFVAALFCLSAFKSTTIWILALGVFAALFSVAAKERTARTSFVFVVASTLTVMLLSRTADLSAIVAAQQGGLLDWYVFRSPASTLAFGVYLYVLSRVSRQNRFSASLYVVAVAVLGAALFLGGWPSSDPIEGIAALAAKAGAQLVAARFFRMPYRVATSTSVLAFALALLSASLEDDALLAFWPPLALGAATALLLRTLLSSPRLRGNLARAGAALQRARGTASRL